MQTVASFIQAFKASGGDSALVQEWWVARTDSPEELSSVAEQIGAAYLSGELSYSLSSGLLNQLMPLAGWERAPKRFWEYYIAFEDAEVLEDPDQQARSSVGALAHAGAT